MFCQNCGKQLPDDSVFCLDCGAPVHPEMKQPGGRARQNTADLSQNRPPIVFYMVATVLLLIVAVVLYFALSNARARDPFHGARLKQQTIWEANGLRVDVTGLRFDEYDAFPYRIELEIANQSGQDLTIQCQAVAINDYMMDRLMSVDVPAGSSVKDALLLSKQSMWRAGIEAIGTIDLILEAADTETGENQLRSDILTLQTNKKVSEENRNIRGEMIYDQNGVRLSYVTCYPQYDDRNQALEFYIENNTDKGLVLQRGTTTAGGVEITDTWLNEIMLPNSRGYVCLKINRSELDAAGQLPMHNVTTEFVFYDLDTGEPLFALPVNLTV